MRERLFRQNECKSDTWPVVCDEGRKPLGTGFVVVIGGSKIKKAQFESHLVDIGCAHVSVYHVEYPLSRASSRVGSFPTVGDTEKHFRDSQDNLYHRLRQLSVLGIVPLVDSAVALADELNCKFGLLGNDPQSSSLRTDKASMQMALCKAGVRYVSSYRVYSIAQAIGVWRQKFNEAPIVLKPPCSGGGDGVEVCTSTFQLKEYMRKYMNGVNLERNVNTSIVMQELLLNNSEYIVNTVSFGKGRHFITDIWRSGSKLSTQEKLVEIPCKYFVYDYQELIQDWTNITEVIKYVNSVLNALGCRYGASHIELSAMEHLVTKDLSNIVLIEVNSRVAGEVRTSNSIPGWLRHDQIYWLLLSILDVPKMEKLYINDVSNIANTVGGSKSSSVIVSRCSVVAVFLKNSKLSIGYMCQSCLYEISSLKTFFKFGRNLAWLNEYRGIENTMLNCPSSRLSVRKTINLVTSPGVVMLVGSIEETQNDLKTIRNLELNRLYYT